jgi:hypothetical protein
MPTPHRESLANPLHPPISCAIVSVPLRETAEVCSLQVMRKREPCDRWRSSTVEQLICNQQVAGSIPIASSTAMRSRIAGVAEWLKAADCKSAGKLPTVVQIHPPAPFPGRCSCGSNSVVESQPSKLLVAGSSPVSRSRKGTTRAHVAQSVEHVLGKDGVTSSSLVVGSRTIDRRAGPSPRGSSTARNSRGRQ